MRYIAQYQQGVFKAMVWLHGAMGEYMVKFYIDGVHQSEADYFTDDKEDAIGTMHHWVDKSMNNDDRAEPKS